ncbi:uncharacterized protein Bfra_004204 [Botrytis fragariae]|uniref:Uncharacterized protein n=1 Tax=Botrytis fragariae TaxID=1964551 RepID=A0A8H6AV77_9HELO|nr:uncharacterized protein Bfra_004204 [Botrytis fragariae]KAF5874198.1 hypothetical protein Bfra_004204 [Botrytis fragariae]
MFEARLERRERVKPQSLGITSDAKNEDMILDAAGLFPIKEPFFVTAKFWKRFSVYASVILSIASLVISSIASLKPRSAADLKGLSFLFLPSPFFLQKIQLTSSSPNSNQHNHQRTLGHSLRAYFSRLAKPGDDGPEIRADVESD